MKQPLMNTIFRFLFFFMGTAVCAMILSMTLDAGAAISNDKAVSRFVLAEEAYTSGDYQLAIDHYNEILEGGKASGPVYYNLGNSYFKNNQLGRAILNYERARLLMPRDGDLEFNYQYALARKTSRLLSERKGFLARALQKHVEFYTFNEMLWIITLAVMLLSVVWLTARFYRWDRRLQRVSYVFLTVVLVIFLVGYIAKARRMDGLAVVVERAEATFEPRKNATVHFPLAEGDKVRVLSREDRWYKISRPDGKQGWVLARDIETIMSGQ